jgi:hypothetical protein
MCDKNELQKLINICFELVLTTNKHILKLSNEEKAKWVAKQLDACGFRTNPCGSSWGVLKEKK